jgi:hypothetical protein
MKLKNSNSAILAKNKNFYQNENQAHKKLQKKKYFISESFPIIIII